MQTRGSFHPFRLRTRARKRNDTELASITLSHHMGGHNEAGMLERGGRTLAAAFRGTLNPKIRSWGIGGAGLKGYESTWSVAPPPFICN